MPIGRISAQRAAFGVFGTIFTESLNGKRKPFPGERFRKLQTHRNAPGLMESARVHHEPEALAAGRPARADVGAHAVVDADDVVPLVRGAELHRAGLAGLAGKDQKKMLRMLQAT